MLALPVAPVSEGFVRVSDYHQAPSNLTYGNPVAQAFVRPKCKGIRRLNAWSMMKGFTSVTCCADSDVRCWRFGAFLAAGRLDPIRRAALFKRRSR